MPASSIDMFYIQNDAKNNFHAMRPVPICNETDNHLLLGHSHNVHISRNCYYGYHDAKSSGNSSESTDYEMKEVPHENIKGPLEINTKKRCADVSAYPRSKRMREEVQKTKNLEPETTENSRLDTKEEDILENLYWNIHGGHMFHLCRVCD